MNLLELQNLAGIEIVIDQRANAISDF